MKGEMQEAHVLRASDESAFLREHRYEKVAFRRVEGRPDDRAGAATPFGEVAQTATVQGGTERSGLMYSVGHGGAKTEIPTKVSRA
jgi:hypothetical protein